MKELDSKEATANRLKTLQESNNMDTKEIQPEEEQSEAERVQICINTFRMLKSQTP